MNEINPILPPELNSAINKFYDVPEPDPDFVQRLDAVLHRRQIELDKPMRKHGTSFLNSGKSFTHMLRARPLLVILVCILAVLLLTGIAYAVAQLAGFIPGIGFVKNVHSVLETPIVVKREIFLTPTSVIVGKVNNAQEIQTPTSEILNDAKPIESPAPVSTLERKGITITVEQVVAEVDRLVIAYKTTGLPPNLFGPERAQALQALLDSQKNEPMPEQVRLPDGTLLEHTHSYNGHCEGGGDLATSWLSCQSIYSPLPDGVNQFTLEIHRLQNALPGELPEDWIIPIRLTPVSAAQTASSLQEPNLRSQPVNGISLRLLKADQSPAQTAFQLGLEWQTPNRYIHHTAPIILQDARDRYYILTGGPDIGSYSIDNPNFSTLPSVVTTPVDGSSQLTFRLDWVVMSVSNPGGARLRFNPGSTAHLGQEWTIDQTISAGGFDFRITKARLKVAEGSAFTFEFDIQAPSGITAVNLTPVEGASMESGYDRARGVMVSRVTLPELPTQPLDLAISDILYKVNGPWEITWQPQQSNATFPTPTPAPTRLAPPAPTFISSAPLLADVQALLSKTPAPTGPGWVHQVTQLDQAASTDVLDTGDQPEQPLHMRVDAWFLLDEQGFIRTTIYIRKTLDGKVLSTDLDNGIYHFSLPEGRGGIGQDVYIAKPSYDLDLLTVLNGYVAEGGKVRQELSTVDGKPCRLYVGTRTYDPPQIFSGEPAPVRDMIYSACIDPVTGAVLQLQSQMAYSDGTTRVKDTTRFISLEKVDKPSDEVRQLLEKVIMP